MSKDKTDASLPTKPGGKGKKLLIFGAAGLALIGGGIGAGVYASGIGLIGDAAKHEDPRRPKLVIRSDHPADHAEGGEGEKKGGIRRVGTVAVEREDAPIDARKYEIAYYPIEQSFTANLADGTGFAQLGISVSTYFDSRVGDNLQRQAIPIRSAVLMVISDQQAAVLATPEGKQALQRQLTKAINQVLRDKEGFGGIDNVYFTSLVVQ
jgi:flagellar protein FliL